jgi:hypothetical protein
MESSNAVRTTCNVSTESANISLSIKITDGQIQVECRELGCITNKRLFSEQSQSVNFNSPFVAAFSNYFSYHMQQNNAISITVGSWLSNDTLHA